MPEPTYGAYDGPFILKAAPEKTKILEAGHGNFPCIMAGGMLVDKEGLSSGVARVLPGHGSSLSWERGHRARTPKNRASRPRSQAPANGQLPRLPRKAKCSCRA